MYTDISVCECACLRICSRVQVCVYLVIENPHFAIRRQRSGSKINLRGPARAPLARPSQNNINSVAAVVSESPRATWERYWDFTRLGPRGGRGAPTEGRRPLGSRLLKEGGAAVMRREALIALVLPLALCFLSFWGWVSLLCMLLLLSPPPIFCLFSVFVICSSWLASPPR